MIIASHNKTIAEINLFLSDWLKIAQIQAYSRLARHEEGLANHRDILDKIRSRDSEGAAAMMKSHLLRTKRVIEKDAALEGGK